MCPCIRVHQRTSVISLFLLHWQCPACLFRFTWMVCEMDDWWPYCCCFVECCFQDLFKTARSILVWFPSCFFSMYFVHIPVVHSYSGMDTLVICLHTVKSLNSSVDGILTDTNTPSQSRPGSNSNEAVLYILQCSKTGASTSDGLVSYPGHTLCGSYPSAEMQSEYSTAPGDWAAIRLSALIKNMLI